MNHFGILISCLLPLIFYWCEQTIALNVPLVNEYQEKTSKPFNRVVLLSLALASIATIGFMIASFVMGKVPTDSGRELLNYVLLFIAVYVSTQAFISDIAILKVNRKILRVAYLIANIATIIYVATDKVTPKYIFMIYALLIICLFVLMLFFAIGASDIRAMLVVCPPAYLLYGDLSIYLMMFVCILPLFFFMLIRKYINERKYYNVIFKQNVLFRGIIIGTIITFMQFFKDKKGLVSIPVSQVFAIPYAFLFFLYPLLH